MYCKKCGNMLDVKDSFCSCCGLQLDSDDTLMRTDSMHDSKKPKESKLAFWLLVVLGIVSIMSGLIFTFHTYKTEQVIGSVQHGIYDLNTGIGTQYWHATITYFFNGDYYRETVDIPADDVESVTEVMSDGSGTIIHATVHPYKSDSAVVIYIMLYSFGAILMVCAYFTKKAYKIPKNLRTF